MRASALFPGKTIVLQPWVPFVAPLALFMILTALEGMIPSRRFYPMAYAVKIGLVGMAIAACWTALPRFDSRGLQGAFVAGIVGFLLWVGLWHTGVDTLATNYLPESLRPGSRTGFDPFEIISTPPAMGLFVVIRLIGLSLVVPLIEEMFWRGFLWRYLQSEQFERVPFGRFTWLSFVGTTLAFATVHPEFVTAAVWGAGMGLVYLWTKNVWACVVTHATTNLLLGVYVLTTGTWILW